MIVANFAEYIMAVRSLYSKEIADILWNYANGRDGLSGISKKEKIRLQKEIFAVRRSIQKLRDEIKNDKDKVSASEKISRLKAQKSELAGKLKALSRSEPFFQMDDEVKSALCLSVLLQKYLTNELAAYPGLLIGKMPDGSVTVDIQALRNSALFRQAAHVKDFVDAYIITHPDKVTSPGYFITLLGKEKNWKKLYEKAEDFFEKQRRKEVKNPEKKNRIRQSRMGVKQLKAYPESGLQAVQLLTEDALVYEGNVMRHCLGAGSYKKHLKNGSRQYYSLREMSVDGEWIPHVTFEYENGKILQCKGFGNQHIAGRYLAETRDFAKILLDVPELDEKSIREKFADCNYAGYEYDSHNRLCDIYGENKSEDFYYLNSLFLSLDDLKKIKMLEKMKVHTLVLTGAANEENIAQLARLAGVTKLFFKDVDFRRFEKLDLSAMKSFQLSESSKSFKSQKEELIRKTDNISCLGEEFGTDIANMIKFGKSCNVKGLKEIRLPEGVEGCETEMIPDGNFQQAVASCVSAGISVLTISDANADGLTRIDFSPYDGLFQFECQNCNFESAKEIVWPRCDVLQFGKVNLDALERFDYHPDLRCLELCGILSTNLKSFVLSPKVEAWKIVNSEGIFNKLDLRDNNTPRAKNMNFDYARNIFFSGLADRLPSEMERLAFFGARAPEKMDLTRYKKLRSLHTDLLYARETTEVRLPESLESWNFDGSCFSGLKKLDLRSLRNLKNLSITDGEFQGLEELLLPEGLEKLVLQDDTFTKLKRLDLSGCRKLKELNLNCSRFDNMQQLRLPKQLAEYKPQRIVFNGQMLYGCEPARAGGGNTAVMRGVGR